MALVTKSADHLRGTCTIWDNYKVMKSTEFLKEGEGNFFHPRYVLDIVFCIISGPNSDQHRETAGYRGAGTIQNTVSMACPCVVERGGCCTIYNTPSEPYHS